MKADRLIVFRGAPKTGGYHLSSQAGTEEPISISAFERGESLSFDLIALVYRLSEDLVIVEVVFDGRRDAMALLCDRLLRR